MTPSHPALPCASSSSRIGPRSSSLTRRLPVVLESRLRNRSRRSSIGRSRRSSPSRRKRSKAKRMASALRPCWMSSKRGTPAASRMAISPSTTASPTTICESDRPIAGKRDTRSSPLRVHIARRPPESADSARYPSYLRSTIQCSSSGGGSLTSVASMGGRRPSRIFSGGGRGARSAPARSGPRVTTRPLTTDSGRAATTS